jgi:hypothetical protein
MKTPPSNGSNKLVSLRDFRHIASLVWLATAVMPSDGTLWTSTRGWNIAPSYMGGIIYQKPMVKSGFTWVAPRR